MITRDPVVLRNRLLNRLHKGIVSVLAATVVGCTVISAFGLYNLGTSVPEKKPIEEFKEDVQPTKE